MKLQALTAPFVAACFCAMSAPGAIAKGAPAPKWADMIECKSEFGDYQDFVLTQFQDAAYKKVNGVSTVAQSNAFVNEYALKTPVTVFGYSTRRILFTNAGVMAIVDEADAPGLAQRLGFENVMNQGERVKATKLVSQSAPETIGQTKVSRRISLDLSTMPGYPGKTVVGCSYRVG